MGKANLRLGLIGAGFLGKAQAFGLVSAPRVFDLPFDLNLMTLADVTEDASARAARTFGCAQHTADPGIDVVHITAPNALHKEMSMAAIAAGKHVCCEKPLTPLAAEAQQRAEARGEDASPLQSPRQPDADDRGGRVGRDPRLSQRACRG